jgi:hypothetical protein
MTTITVDTISILEGGQIQFIFSDGSGLLFASQNDMTKDVSNAMSYFAENLKWIAVNEYLRTSDLTFSINFDPQNTNGIYIERDL